MTFSFLHNFFTLSSLNYTIFTIFFVGYLMVVRQKSKATRDMIFLFMILSSMAFAYYLAYLIPNPVMAYHRWVTVAVSLFGTAGVSAFFFDYPEPIWPRARKIFIAITYTGAALLSLTFVYQSLSAPKVYEFDGHYYDVDLPNLGRWVGILILLYVFLYTVGGVIRIIKAKQKWPVAGILLGFWLVIFFPGVVNLLNRMNLIDRETFQTIWNVSGVLGVFAVQIIYVNRMTERTTLLMKLYAISLVTVLLILQAINVYLLRDRDGLYDSLQIEKAGRAIVDTSYRPVDLSCIAKVNTDGSSTILYEDSLHQPGLCGQSQILQATEGIIERYTRGESIDNIEATTQPSLLPALQGTFTWLRSQEQSLKASTQEGIVGQNERVEILNQFLSNRNRVKRIRGLIERLPGKDFRKEFEKAVEPIQKDPFLSPRIAAVLNGPASFFTDRRSLIELFPEPLGINDRSFGIDRIKPESPNPLEGKYVNFFIESGTELYQVDFEYADYRKFLDSGSSVMNRLQIIVTVLIMVGYPIFFLGALLTPLRSLLAGVENVNRGDLDVKLKVRVEDEIGFLTRNFNSMVDSIRSARQELKEYADQLEQRVLERTEELQKTLVEVRTLKEAQDGDYFLTSLLLRPLSTNHVPADSACKVRFVVRQKKRFSFRRWNDEIGGDLCTAHRIVLRGRNYIFAVNADAMGKSIQGAGGALVLGAVIESLVERTKYSDLDREQLPEKWLKLAFVELHRVFESFDGSMLVSLIMSLVDEETGFVYFINAEHPFPILVRDGQASFLEQTEPLRKLGMTGMDGFISIQTISLKLGDTLIFGSDGKDDVIVGEHDGIRVINEDEGQILGIASLANGDPQQMADLLEERYELMDDLSLLSIHYSPDTDEYRRRWTISRQLKDDIDRVRAGKIDDNEAIQILVKGMQEFPHNVQVHKQLASLYLKTKQYGRAIIHMEKYLRYKPEDNEMLLRVFLLMKNRNLLARAAEYGEIYHLRYPDDERVMSALVSVYDKLNNRIREEKFRHRLSVLRQNRSSTSTDSNDGIDGD